MIKPMCEKCAPGRGCGRRADWEIWSVATSGHGLHVQGWNHSSGEPFSWGYESSRASYLTHNPRFDLARLSGQFSALKGRANA